MKFGVDPETGEEHCDDEVVFEVLQVAASDGHVWPRAGGLDDQDAVLLEAYAEYQGYVAVEEKRRQEEAERKAGRDQLVGPHGEPIDHPAAFGPEPR